MLVSMMMNPGPLLFALLHWLVSGAAIVLTAYLVKGFRVKDFPSALIVSLVLGLIGWTIRPILLFLSLPFTIVTLGLFIFVVDAACLRICSGLLKGFEVKGWGPAIWGALVLTLSNWALHSLFI